MSVEEQIIKLIHDQTAVTVTIDTKLDDAGLDSLDTMEIVVGIEEIFDVEIPDDEIEDLKSVRDIVNSVIKKA